MSQKKAARAGGKKQFFRSHCMTSLQSGAGPVRQLAPSTKRNPCPVCGRTKDRDCRFSDGLILCHQGSTSGPPAHLIPGDTITIEGQRWALVSRSGGYSGCAAVFRPDRGRDEANHAPRPQEQQNLENRAGIARATIDAWLRLADQALEVPRFQDLTVPEVDGYCELISEAYRKGVSLQQSLEPLCRQYRALGPYREEVADALKEVGYQQRDAVQWRKNNFGIENGGVVR